MNIEHIDQPCHQGPCLLRIPGPVMSPCLLCPKRSRQHSESQESHTYIYKRIRCRQNILRTGHQTHHGKYESAAEQRIREHVHSDMRNEPRTLQRRHQRLVMYLRTDNVKDHEHRGQNGRERQYPSIPPHQIGQQTRKQSEERIPQSGLPHRPHRRTTQRDPKSHNESAQHSQRSERQS